MRRTATITRTIRLVVVFALLGAATNLLIIAAVACWSPIFDDCDRTLAMWDGGDYFGISIGGDACSFEMVNGIASTRYLWIRYSPSAIPRTGATVHPLPSWIPFEEAFGDSYLWFESRGWPMRSLWCMTTSDTVLPKSWEPQDMRRHLHGGIALAPEPPPFRPVFTGIYIHMGWEPLRAMPLRPIWPGLLVNTAFYGSIIWLLWFGPGMIRRGVRRRRGSCVRCGYDLRGSADGVCPECGGGSP